MTSRTAQVPPGPGFVAGIRLATGVHQTPAYSVAQVLAHHVPARLRHESPKGIRAGMRDFAEALRLGPPDVDPPMIGSRIRLLRREAWLNYGDEEYVLCLPTADSWIQLAEAGGPIRICVLFEPICDTTGQQQLDTHLRRCFVRGDMAWGTTYATHGSVVPA